mmetsp:Transcript_105404/g.198485  ORF Transcript_105404/g.198485 Transcript_105404/m.198485 type:complete len:83 (-) Transcript_105404:16-264(-)
MHAAPYDRLAFWSASRGQLRSPGLPSRRVDLSGAPKEPGFQHGALQLTAQPKTALPVALPRWTGLSLQLVASPVVTGPEGER